LLIDRSTRDGQKSISFDHFVLVNSRIRLLLQCVSSSPPLSVGGRGVQDGVGEAVYRCAKVRWMLQSRGHAMGRETHRTLNSRSLVIYQYLAARLKPPKFGVLLRPYRHYGTTAFHSNILTSSLSSIIHHIFWCRTKFCVTFNHFLYCLQHIRLCDGFPSRSNRKHPSLSTNTA